MPEVIVQQLDWEQLDSWITPNDQFFVIKHFNLPELNENDWRLEISGLVDQPMTLTLDDLKARERQEVTFTLECSGNTGLPFFNGGIGNATWAGTPLAPLLEEAGVQEPGIEVVFWGADAGEQTWRRHEDHRALRPQHVAGRRHEPRQPARLRDERRAAAAAARLPAAADRAGLVRDRQREVADADRGAGSAATRATSWPATT